MTYQELLNDESVRDEINNPKWETVDSRPVQDWRAYLYDDVRSIWDTLQYETKVAFYYMAETRADTEEWD